MLIVACLEMTSGDNGVNFAGSSVVRSCSQAGVNRERENVPAQSEAVGRTSAYSREVDQGGQKSSTQRDPASLSGNSVVDPANPSNNRGAHLLAKPFALRSHSCRLLHQI